MILWSCWFGWKFKGTWGNAWKSATPNLMVYTVHFHSKTSSLEKKHMFPDTNLWPQVKQLPCKWLWSRSNWWQSPEGPSTSLPHVAVPILHLPRYDSGSPLKWSFWTSHIKTPMIHQHAIYIISIYIIIIYLPMMIIHYLGLMNKFMFPLSLSLFCFPLPRTAQIDNKNRWGQSLQLSCMGFKSPMYRINLDPSNDIPHWPFSNTIYCFFVKLHERLALSLSNIYILWSLQHPRCITSVSNPVEHPSSHHRQPRLGSTKASAAR